MIELYGTDRPASAPTHRHARPPPRAPALSVPTSALRGWLAEVACLFRKFKVALGRPGLRPACAGRYLRFSCTAGRGPGLSRTGEIQLEPDRLPAVPRHSPPPRRHGGTAARLARPCLGGSPRAPPAGAASGSRRGRRPCLLSEVRPHHPPQHPVPTWIDRHQAHPLLHRGRAGGTCTPPPGPTQPGLSTRDQETEPVACAEDPSQTRHGPARPLGPQPDLEAEEHPPGRKASTHRIAFLVNLGLGAL